MNRFKIQFFCYLFLAFYSAHALSESETTKKNLMPEPKEENSLETIEENISSIGICDNALFLLPEQKKFLIRTPFDLSQTSREKRFGRFVDSKRIEINKLPDTTFHGIFCDKNFYYLLDGRQLEIVKIGQNFSIYNKKYIIWDRIRPARDKRGEAPQFEIIDLRKKFSKAITTTERRPILAWAEIPDNWAEKKEFSHVLLSSIQRYPILLLTCQKDDPAQCEVMRTCFVEQTIDTSQATGITLSKEKNLYISYSDSHILDVFKFNSCYSITHKETLSLPRQIKSVSNLYMDKEKNLWITSSEKSDVFNASVFLFPHFEQ